MSQQAKHAPELCDCIYLQLRRIRSSWLNPTFLIWLNPLDDETLRREMMPEAYGNKNGVRKLFGEKVIVSNDVTFGEPVVERV